MAGRANLLGPGLASDGNRNGCNVHADDLDDPDDEDQTALQPALAVLLAARLRPAPWRRRRTCCRRRRWWSEAVMLAVW